MPEDIWRFFKALTNRRYRAYHKYLGLAFKIIRHNAEFLWLKEKRLIEEIIEFQNDAGDYLYECHERFRKSSYRENYMSIFCLPNYIQTILLPAAYSLLPVLLTGYVPHCYSSLRLCVEGFGLMYLAEDLPYNWFQRKVERLREIIGNESITRVLNRIEPRLGEFFKRFSGWLHPTSYMRQIIEQVISGHQLPPHALGSPMPYNDDDLKLLSRLEQDIRSVREVIKSLLNEWYRKVGI